MLPSEQITRTATSNVIAIQNATLGNLPNFSDIASRTKSPLLGKVHMAHRQVHPWVARRTEKWAGPLSDPALAPSASGNWKQ
jgi:hypothetical protein